MSWWLIAICVCLVLNFECLYIVYFSTQFLPLRKCKLMHEIVSAFLYRFNNIYLISYRNCDLSHLLHNINSAILLSNHFRLTLQLDIHHISSKLIWSSYVYLFCATLTHLALPLNFTRQSSVPFYLIMRRSKSLTKSRTNPIFNQYIATLI